MREVLTVATVTILGAGVLEVVRRAGAGLGPGTPLLLCTKGFGRRPDGRVGLLPPLVTAALPDPLAATCPVVAVGGPCKANEVAAGRPTAAVFAGLDETVVEGCARALGTPAYRVARSGDLDGVEAAAATKNVYATAAGQTVEGVPAARLARELAAQLAPELPLLAAVNRVLDGDPDPAALLVGAVLPR